MLMYKHTHMYVWTGTMAPTHGKTKYSIQKKKKTIKTTTHRTKNLCCIWDHSHAQPPYLFPTSVNFSFSYNPFPISLPFCSVLWAIRFNQGCLCDHRLGTRHWNLVVSPLCRLMKTLTRSEWAVDNTSAKRGRIPWTCLHSWLTVRRAQPSVGSIQLKLLWVNECTGCAMPRDGIWSLSSYLLALIISHLPSDMVLGDLTGVAYLYCLGLNTYLPVISP